MNKHLYLQQQIEQALSIPALCPSSLFYTAPLPAQPCFAPGSLYGSAPHPQKPRKGDQGGAWLRAGWGVPFHILLCSKPGRQRRAGTRSRER